MPAKLNDDDVLDLASQIGASVNVGGRKFNAAQVPGVRRTSPLSQLLDERLGRRAPAVDMTPVLDEMKENQAELLKVVGTALARIQRPAAVAPAVTVEPQIHVSPPVVSPPAAVSWRFEFERDSNDRISAMTATPIL